MPPDLLHADFAAADAVSLGGHFLHAHNGRTLRTLNLLESHPHLQLDGDGERIAADICQHLLGFTEDVIRQPTQFLSAVQLERYALALKIYVADAVKDDFYKDGVDTGHFLRKRVFLRKVYEGRLLEMLDEVVKTRLGRRGAGVGIAGTKRRERA